MSDVSAHAATCCACAALTVQATDPVSILERLPARLFNAERPIAPITAQFPVELDVDIFGPVGGTEPTPQYELARLFAQEKDHFIRTWRQAEAQQHSLGILTDTPEGVKGQCPHAVGGDLDRIGAQYDVGRPLGFSDCCYARLIQLLCWESGNTLWVLLELAELYTGQRPGVIEEPAKLILVWPLDEDETFFDQDGFYDQTAHFGGEPGPGALEEDDGWWCDSDSDVDSYWSATTPQAIGLTLAQALARRKAAGVFLALQNVPPLSGGCSGATLTAAITPPEAFWA